jgi:hypothetical protein
MYRRNSISDVARHLKGVVAGVSGLLAVFCLAASAQESATLHGEEFVKAGETLNLVITLDKAPNFKGSQLDVHLHTPKGDVGYGITLEPGKTAYTLGISVPGAAPGGTWSVSDLEFISGGDARFPLPFPKFSFYVIAGKDLTYPSAADVGVSPSQAQLLRTEAIHLQAQIQDLKGQILEHRTDSKLSSLLRENIERAIQSIGATEHAFRALDSSSKPEESSQIFFDDLRTSYREVDHEVRALEISWHADDSLLLVAAPQGQSEAVHYPVVAQAVLRAFEQNELAYNTVAELQTLAFDLEVSSIPAGATVSYRRRGDEFKQASTPTDSTIKALTFAIWIIRFEKEGFRAVEREHDPFREPNHVVTVQLSKAK